MYWGTVSILEDLPDWQSFKFMNILCFRAVVFAKYSTASLMALIKVKFDKIFVSFCFIPLDYKEKNCLETPFLITQFQ